MSENANVAFMEYDQMSQSLQGTGTSDLYEEKSPGQEIILWTIGFSQLLASFQIVRWHVLVHLGGHDDDACTATRAIGLRICVCRSASSGPQW